MKYTVKDLGEDLKRELSKGYDVQRIADWAYDLVSYGRLNFNDEARKALHYIALMDAGEEFEYTEQELETIANNLINNKSDPFEGLGK